METVLAAIAGLVVGVVIGRSSKSSQQVPPPKRAAAPLPVQAGGRRPNRRQRRILETLPVDPPRPTIEDIIEEEARELGLDRIGSDRYIPMPIRLKVYRRDSSRFTETPLEHLQYAFTGAADETPDTDNVRLEPKTSEDLDA